MDGAGIRNPRIAFQSYKYTHVHHRIHRRTFASWNAAETGKSCPLGSFELTSGPDRLNGSQKLSRRSDCCLWCSVTVVPKMRRGERGSSR